MKKTYYKSFMMAICLLFAHAMIAQDTVTVAPGLGTLEAAIAQDGGSKVYKLTAGAWYGLTSIVEVSDNTIGAGNGLTIIGEETDGMPAIIQVGVDGAGSVFPALFNTFNDFTIKNVFLSAQDFTGIVGASVIQINNEIDLVVDNVTIDPAGINYTFQGSAAAAGSNVYVTNSLILRNGQMSGPNDGGIFSLMACDTLYFENNTVVSSGQDFIVGSGAFHSAPPLNFIWVNHNSFFYHDVWIKKTYNDEQIYMTNNLFHDISIFGQLYAWGQFFPDYPVGNEILSQVAADTSEVGGIEALPSQRVSFWQRNLQYNSNGLKSLPTFARDNGLQPIYLIPLLWDENTPQEYAADFPIDSLADKSRDHRIFNDDTNFPNFKYNHTWYDVDPGYNDPRIYQVSDSVGEHIIGWFSKLIWALEGAPEVADLPSYNWDIDDWAGTTPAEYPVVWPRFDGSYTNPDLLKASTANLPLGDLNWFPEAKAKWEGDKSRIMDHILSLDESQIAVTSVKPTFDDNSLKIYPNPAKNQLRIESKNMLRNVNIYSISGQLMKTQEINGRTANIELSGMERGVYIVEATSIEGARFTYKLIKE